MASGNQESMRKGEGRSEVEILAQLAREAGELPAPVQLMAMRPGTASAFLAYRDRILEGGPLSDRERALVQLAAAVAMQLCHCIGKQVQNARKAGANQDEIVQVMLIASLQAGTSMLSTAHEGLRPT